MAPEQEEGGDTASPFEFRTGRGAAARVSCSESMGESQHSSGTKTAHIRLGLADMDQKTSAA